MTSLPVSFRPDLVEEVVLWAVGGSAEESRFRRERDPLYLQPENERERAFAQFHLNWFIRLRLDQTIHQALAELPDLAQACGRCIVSRAAIRNQEAADLLVAADAEGRDARTIVIRLCASSFAEPDGLLAWLRPELMHVADMVDPAFGYEPVLPRTEAGPSFEGLLRDRYRVLWNVSIAGRLLRRGVAAPGAEAEARRGFTTAFPMLGEASDEAFVRFFSGAAGTHAELVAFVLSPRGEKAVRGLAPGGRCPLCRFPTYGREPDPETLAADVVACIQSEFPTWEPADGLCSQCAELYRAREMSLAAAKAIPGWIDTAAAKS
ncbi:MAG: hypothetical protein HY699_12230 [Deltaproteobacteria bacterium]|nr:hypothetical protein [Deltaproteobacteria bacterium]